ncbi:hypothetical protein [Paraburkholderia caribensis]|uniref:hypothetical protein n=1 Tax=Paraburkholderia caribensis TaxID=75105 RepID=UPI001D0975B4|nr:hypothetical protein [Paraburkholderia caribensis]
MTTREDFEAAWSNEYPLHGESAFRRSGFNPDAYVNTRVHDGWLMWQAATARAGTRQEFLTVLGYPWLPCPICKGTEGCDHVVAERARAALTGRHSPEAVKPEYSPEPVRAYPEELTPSLREVLGMMIWNTAPIAHAMRASGRTIARKVEEEQAVVLHWLTGIVLEHGDDWQKHAAIELRKLTDAMG